MYLKKIDVNIIFEFYLHIELCNEMYTQVFNYKYIKNFMTYTPQYVIKFLHWEN